MSGQPAPFDTPSPKFTLLKLEKKKKKPEQNNLWNLCGQTFYPTGRWNRDNSLIWIKGYCRPLRHKITFFKRQKQVDYWLAKVFNHPKPLWLKYIFVQTHKVMPNKNEKQTANMFNPLVCWMDASKSFIKVWCVHTELWAFWLLVHILASYCHPRLPSISPMLVSSYSFSLLLL